MRGFPYERLFFLLLISTFFTSFGNAQEVWSLQRCIEYARDHSLNIKQADYNVTLAHVNARQARLERLPNLSASVTGGVQWGRTIDPTTNDFNNQRISFNSYGVNANALVYGGGRITNGIRQMDMQLKASEYDSDYAFNLTALNIANAYLQILQSEEQLENARKRHELSLKQLEQTEKLIEAGVIPENDRLDILAQVARDEQAIVQAENLVEFNYLNLKDQMFLDLSTEIKVEAPELVIPADANPEAMNFLELYTQALGTQPQVKAEEYRLESAIIGESIAKASLYPTLAVFAGIDTRWSSAAKSVTGFQSDIQEQTIYIDNTPVTVGFPVDIPLLEKTSYRDQLDQNFGQNLGISLSLPIFNNGRSAASLQRAEISTQIADVRNEQVKQQLRTEVHTALANARAAHRAYEASLKSYEAAQRAFENAQKRFDLGSINTLEYTSARNALDMAENDLTVNRYDYLFRLKILDFYLGREIKLD